MDWYKLVNKIPIKCETMEEYVEWCNRCEKTKENNVKRNVLIEKRFCFTKLLDERRVGYVTFKNNITISTVFLGANHRHGKGLPVLFETMIFGGKNNEFQRRYCTFAEAEKGHKEAVKKCIQEIKENENNKKSTNRIDRSER